MIAPLLLLASLLPRAAGAATPTETEVRGRVFYSVRSATKPSFTFDTKVETKDGHTKVTNSYNDLNGKPLIVEETELQGDRLVRYDYKQNQVNESGGATFEDGKIQMTFVEAGKASKDTEVYDPTTIVAPMVQPLIQRRWDELMKGESVRVRYLAIERLETIGFKFYKDGERTVNGKAGVDIVMKPSSFFIAALVNPIRITVLKDAPHWILESEGRTPVRVPKKEPPKVRADWRAIDAHVEYDPPVTH